MQNKPEVEPKILQHLYAAHPSIIQTAISQLPSNTSDEFFLILVQAKGSEENGRSGEAEQPAGAVQDGAEPGATGFDQSVSHQLTGLLQQPLLWSIFDDKQQWGGAGKRGHTKPIPHRVPRELGRPMINMDALAAEQGPQPDPAATTPLLASLSKLLEVFTESGQRSAEAELVAGGA
jgi:hypothetical protein